jgi:diaminopimelate epimerase
MRFTKFQGFGNDYLVFEANNRRQLMTSAIWPVVFAIVITARAATASPYPRADTDDADFSIRIFNPDGSEAGMSGNGTRCAAAYLFFHGLWSNELLRLQTRTGIKRYHLLERSGQGSFLFRSELGQPRFDSASIPMTTGQPLDRVIDYPLNVMALS